jgi:hemerythrin-like domain-containing protein
MTKRHDALLPLTHDHHHALVQARRLIAAADADEKTRSEVAEEFLRFYEEHTLLHFHEEEEELFPRLLGRVEEPPPELVQVLIEHVQMHGMVQDLRDAAAEGAPSGEDLKKLGETLRGHVRLEENKLFPLIEEALSGGDLDRLEFAERDRG